MIAESVRKEIKGVIAGYPKRESALMPALMLAQKGNKNVLTRKEIDEVADIVGVTSSKAMGVATFYTMYNVRDSIGQYHLQVDTNIPATLMGARKILAHLESKLGIKAGETTPDGLFTLSEVECLASCGSCPVIQVNDTYYENMDIAKVDALIDSLKKGVMPDNKTEYHWGTVCNVLLKNRGVDNAKSIDVYKKNGGYAALAKARTMTPDAIVKEVKASVIRGRGGAGFPAGVKWGFLPKDNAKPVYLICNADEGEPGTYKDRQIMEYDPHLLVEGMAISALALGAKQAFIYIRGEFGWIADILEKAIAEAKADGQLKDFDIKVHRGAGAYVCGEETALIESIEGKRGQPRIKPPFPAVQGLYGCPTIVNNVETLASVPFIVEQGADAFQKFGSPNNTGFKIFGISGNVNKPGCYEYPMGTSFNDLIAAAGGVKGKLKAAIVGGLSVAIMTADELQNLKMSYDSCFENGTALGSGGIMVINDEWSIPDLALRTIKFYAHESCGKCVPCKQGSHMIVMALEKIVAGKGTQEDLANVERLVGTIKGLTLCPVGEAFSVPIKAMVEKFRPEFEALLVK
ncbi:MAG: NADH-quinone oxidoreductase subunit 1 [Betaproteobacteria bacterium ADurb.Bin341]|nr:MAG: NADH-quinone oxidoreductase subunit 1 [Betaproteobacteria bacterium ADurb.Bin341]